MASGTAQHPSDRGHPRDGDQPGAVRSHVFEPVGQGDRAAPPRRGTPFVSGTRIITGAAGQWTFRAQRSAAFGAGGTGAGVTVQPMGFLVVGKESVRLLPAQYYAPVDRMIELAPQLMCEIKNALMKWCKKDGAENAAQPPVPPAS